MTLGLPLYVRQAAKWLVQTAAGRALLEQLATADELVGRELLEQLAKRYGAKLELWE